MKPNIIYVLCDDLGYGDVQCLNPQRGKIPTPNINRLAKEGMTFTDAHSCSSVCTPSRYGILTGRYAWRTRLQSGVLDNYVTPLIAADRLTVPSLLKLSGYHTACIGKWHLGFTVDREADLSEKFMGAPLGARTADGPTTRGFDFFYGFHHARMMRSVFTDDRVTEMVEPVDLLPRLTERAGQYIAERAKTKQPFFLYLALNSPHTPIVPSAPWVGKSQLNHYGDFVMETDWALGQVMKSVAQAGIENDTLLIFTSDNGCSPQADTAGMERQGHFASAAFRGYKTDIWDGGHRIPLIVRWPGHVNAGSHNDRLTCLTDLLATCADLTGAKLPDPAGEDSVSMLPALRGKTEASRRDAVVHHSIDGSFSIRQGRWKLELCAGSGGWGKPGNADAQQQGLPEVQLYDLAADIGERHNVQAQHPEVVTQMTKMLEKVIAEGRSTPGASQKNDALITLRKKPTQ
jgi:arylsulfatase A-like enzyme